MDPDAVHASVHDQVGARRPHIPDQPIDGRVAPLAGEVALVIDQDDVVADGARERSSGQSRKGRLKLDGLDARKARRAMARVVSA